MSNPYEIEHNIKHVAERRSRRPDMSSFVNAISQISTESTATRTHNNPNALPTPGDIAAAARLLQDQFSTLLASSPDSPNQELLDGLIQAIQSEIESPPDKVKGLPQSYLDELERIPKNKLKKDETCPICAERFLDDPYPLVVVLPCHASHRFDLECVGPWLMLQGTCPLDRKDLGKKKEVPKVENEEEEDYDEMFA